MFASYKIITGRALELMMIHSAKTRQGFNLGKDYTNLNGDPVPQYGKLFFKCSHVKLISMRERHLIQALERDTLLCPLVQLKRY